MRQGRRWRKGEMLKVTDLQNAIKCIYMSLIFQHFPRQETQIHALTLVVWWCRNVTKHVQINKLKATALRQHIMGRNVDAVAFRHISNSGQSLAVEVRLLFPTTVERRHNSNLRGVAFSSKCTRNALGGRAPLGPAGGSA